MKNILLVVDIQNGFIVNEMTRDTLRRVEELLHASVFDAVIATKYMNYPGSPIIELMGWDLLLTEEEQALAGSPINVEDVKAYVEQIREVSASQGIAAPKDGVWDVLVRLPETTQPAVAEELSDEEWAATEQAVDEALARFESFRRQEGDALRAKL